MQHYRIHPRRSFHGELHMPGDKSLSHRALMFSALARGESHLNGLLEAGDTLATLAAMRAMGVSIVQRAEGEYRVHGVGMGGLLSPSKALDVGNSGTSMRLLSGLLAGQGVTATLSGDRSLSRRPMRRVVDPLRRMGADIVASEDGTAPLHIRKTATPLQGQHHDLPVASAQLKSALLLAGLGAEGETSVTEPAPTRDHTERMLQGMGYEVWKRQGRIGLSGGGGLQPVEMTVPGDLSSAAFFLVAASIAESGDVLLRHVGINPTRSGVLEILRLMGADIEVLAQREVSGEPVADLRVRSAALQGIDIPEHLVPLAIDELPVLLVAAACAEGTTRLRGAAELRVKESDRIQAMSEGLTAIGVANETRPDGMILEGGGGLIGGCVESHDDHRIAMSFAVASLRARNPIDVRDAANIATSFPSFQTLVNGCGLSMEAL